MSFFKTKNLDEQKIKALQEQVHSLSLKVDFLMKQNDSMRNQLTELFLNKDLFADYEHTLKEKAVTINHFTTAFANLLKIIEK